jgi:prevent-host-death family protein
MTTVGSTEAMASLPQLLQRVTRGEKIVITEQGRPVAMLVPAPPEAAQDVRQVIEQFKAYSKQQGRTLGGLTFRDLVEEGRRY